MHARGLRKYYLRPVLAGSVVLLALSFIISAHFLYIGKAWKLFAGESVSQFYFNRGNHYFGGGTYNLIKARRAYKTALLLDSTIPGANYQLARVSFIEGRQQEALIYIKHELELYPEFKRSHYVRGLIYGYIGHYELAEQDFKEFLRWRPDSWAGHNDLAWIYFSQNKFKEAALTAENGLQAAPNNPWLHNSLGVALLNLKQFDEAIEHLQLAEQGFATLTSDMWGSAYPGNDPAIYAAGLAQVRQEVLRNLDTARAEIEK